MQWAHTAQVIFYICEVNRDPKKGPKRTPADYNPWESKGSKKSGVPLAENFKQLKQLAGWRPS